MRRVKGAPELPVMKSYRLKVAPECNLGKLHALAEVEREWRRALPEAFNWYWAPFLTQGQFDPSLTTSGPTSTFPETRLVTSQKDLMKVALQGQAQGWLSNLKNRCRGEILRSFEPGVLRHELLWLNAWGLWNASNVTQNAKLTEVNAKPRAQRKNQPTDIQQGELPDRARSFDDRLTVISEKATGLLQGWFERHLVQHRLPEPSELPLQFNVLSSTWGQAERTDYEHFGYWASVSSLERGQRIALPLQGYAYVDQALSGITPLPKPAAKGESIVVDDNPALPYGTVSKTLTFLRQTQKGRRYQKGKGKSHKRSKDNAKTSWLASFTIERQAQPWKTFKTAELALDLGLRNFLASSDGDLRGVNFLDTLKAYDQRLQAVMKGLQQAGRNPGDCASYNDLVAQVRGFVKTQVKTWLWSILNARRPALVVVERLSFTDSKDEAGSLGKTLNRLVRNFGQRVFKDSLTEWSKEYGFAVVEEEPAYTSQRCKPCGFVHGSNRRGNRFSCGTCGHTGHSDTNGAKNLLERFQRRSSQPGADALLRGRSGLRQRWTEELERWVLGLWNRLVLEDPRLDEDSPCSACGSIKRLVGQARRGAALLYAEHKPFKAVPRTVEAGLWAMGVLPPPPRVPARRKPGNVLQRTS